MSKLRPAEYVELKGFLQAFTERFFPSDLAAELRPLELLAALETISPARASLGLRMAVNDCIEMSSHWTPAKVAALDSDLKANNLLTLSEVRRRYSSAYAALRKRGRIRNEVEYYLARGILADQSLYLEAEERSELSLMVASYERQATNR